MISSFTVEKWNTGFAVISFAVGGTHAVDPRELVLSAGESRVVVFGSQTVLFGPGDTPYLFFCFLLPVIFAAKEKLAYLKVFTVC